MNKESYTGTEAKTLAVAIALELTGAHAGAATVSVTDGCFLNRRA